MNVSDALGKNEQLRYGSRKGICIITSLSVRKKWEPFIRANVQSGGYGSGDEILD